jgi:hypothetical protein
LGLRGNCESLFEDTNGLEGYKEMKLVAEMKMRWRMRGAVDAEIPLIVGKARLGCNLTSDAKQPTFSYGRRFRRTWLIVTAYTRSSHPFKKYKTVVKEMRLQKRQPCYLAIPSSRS